MGSPRMILSLALVFSLTLAVTDARPRAKRQTTNSTGCQGGDVESDMGTIQIGNGESYTNNEQCCFTFSPAMLVDQPLEVELQFDYFNVEDHAQCLYDYVSYEVSSGQVDRDCGFYTGDYIRNFRSTGWFKLCFHSDNSMTERGIKLNYFIFPGIPEDFESSTPRAPTYNFTVETTGHPNFTFPDHNVTHLTTGPSNHTHPDHNVTYWTTVPSNVTYPDHNVTVVPTMPPNNTCNHYLTGHHGHFNSPGWNMSYPNSKDCNTTIAGPASNYTLSITFRAFDIEGANNCQYDYLQLVWSTNSTGKACGHQWRNTTLNFNITGGDVTAVFHSDGSVTKGGFHATYNIIMHAPPTTAAPNTTVVPTTRMPNITDTCNHYLTGHHGHFNSPGWNMSYPNSKDCNTTIAGPASNYTLSITFRAFDIEGANNCQYDYLQLVWSTNSTGKACGNQWRNTTLNFNITGGDVTAVFHSDGSVTKGGFHATYNIIMHAPPTTAAPNTTVVPTTRMPNITACSYTSDALVGEYTLRTGPNGDYSSNEYCTINLRAPSLPHETVLNFTHFDVEQHDHCSYDSLDVVVGSRIVDKLCGTLDPFSKIYNNSGNLRLTFTSDYSVQKTGFSFRYSHHVKYCNATINGTSGSFATPPGGYKNNEVCFYTILTPTPAQLNFTFSRFDIENTYRCQFDSLSMGEDKLCGTSTQNRSYTSDGRFVMKLSTDGSVRRDGFHMSFTSTPLA